MKPTGKEKRTPAAQRTRCGSFFTEGSDEERATRTIDATERFFRSLGLQTRLHEVGIGEDTICEIERRFNERGVAFGEGHNVTGTVARRILEEVR